MTNFVHDEQSSGHLRMPQERLMEMISILRAISTLIEGLAKRNDAQKSDFFHEIVNIYPLLVDCLPSSRADPQ
ncbi:unnamed protein product, partial [Anisakis simplex]|uniref:Monensin-resistant homolog 2 (inferred by orthology to a C. elegans protein) n=1 Tax=Anisakis simplex TaxID=6269 RepID=A0A0M3JM97_ANISI